MQNVFIDTCVFEKEWFYRGARIKTLFSAASKGRIRIILPDLTEFEVIKHNKVCNVDIFCNFAPES